MILLAGTREARGSSGWQPKLHFIWSTSQELYTQFTLYFVLLWLTNFTHILQGYLTVSGAYLSRLPWIFPGAPLKVNGAPGNIQGNLCWCNHEIAAVLVKKPCEYIWINHMNWLRTDNIPTIDLLCKSHNAPDPYPTMHYFLTEMCIFLLQNGALWDICLMHRGICEKDLSKRLSKTMSTFNGIHCICIEQILFLTTHVKLWKHISLRLYSINLVYWFDVTSQMTTMFMWHSRCWNKNTSICALLRAGNQRFL